MCLSENVCKLPEQESTKGMINRQNLATGFIDFQLALTANQEITIVVGKIRKKKPEIFKINVHNPRNSLTVISNHKTWCRYHWQSNRIFF